MAKATTKPNKQKSTVWKFTNQKELDKNQFIDYFERKVFRTIRKHQMLPSTKIFKIKKQDDLNTIVLTKILQAKFQVKLISTTDKKQLTTKTTNLSQLAEDIFKNIIKGKFKNKTPTNAPLINLSDKEINLYAKLKNIKGKQRKQNKKIQSLFEKFLSKNQDLEINILNAQSQLNEKK